MARISARSALSTPLRTNKLRLFPYLMEVLQWVPRTTLEPITSISRTCPTTNNPSMLELPAEQTRTSILELRLDVRNRS
jgi:hypothetical protein